MVRTISLVLLAGTVLGAGSIDAAHAADVSFKSQISHVTVFPQGAKVTRQATGTLPAGEHVILIQDVPGDIDPDSVRVKGMASGLLSQNSVDVKRLPLYPEASSEKRKELEAALDKLNDERQVLDLQLIDIAALRDILKKQIPNTYTKIVMRPLASGQEGADPATGLSALMTNITQQLSDLVKQESAFKVRQRVIHKESNELRSKLESLGPDKKGELVFAINVSAERRVDAQFAVEYQVRGASWRPVYDAELAVGENGENARIALKKRAEVQQTTGEDWNDIEMELSTVRPSNATQVANLKMMPVDFWERNIARSEGRKMRKLKRKIQSSAVKDTSLASERVEDQLNESVEASAPIVAANFDGLQASFTIPGKVSVEKTGNRKNVQIGNYDVKVNLKAVTAPHVEQVAYLTAEFIYDGNTPLLPGTVLLHRDGTYVGKGRVPMVRDGEEHALGFGQDDLIKVEHIDLGKKTGETGILSTSNIKDYKYRTKIRNLHGFAMDVRVLDRLPISKDDKILVEMVKASTKPDERDVDDNKGVLAWNKTLKSGEEYSVNFGYRITWPENTQINPIN